MLVLFFFYFSIESLKLEARTLANISAFSLAIFLGKSISWQTFFQITLVLLLLCQTSSFPRNISGFCLSVCLYVCFKVFILKHLLICLKLKINQSLVIVYLFPVSLFEKSV